MEELKKFVHDPEVAHGFEDWIYTTVLDAIALDQCESPKACAAAAIKSEEIGFVRYCA